MHTTAEPKLHDCVYSTWHERAAQESSVLSHKGGEVVHRTPRKDGTVLACLQAILEELEAKGLSVHFADYSAWGPALSDLLRRAKIVPQSASQRRQNIGDVPYRGVPELRRPGIFTHSAILCQKSVNRRQCGALKVQNQEMCQQAGNFRTLEDEQAADDVPFVRLLHIIGVTLLREGSGDSEQVQAVLVKILLSPTASHAGGQFMASPHTHAKDCYLDNRPTWGDYVQQIVISYGLS